MSDARANRKSPVRIATVLSQRAFADWRTAAQRRLVHDVVVVERREVGQLDDDGGGHDAGRGRVAELRGQQHEQRPEPLAAGVDQVPGGLGDERVVALDRLAQQLLDLRPDPARIAASSAGRRVEAERRAARRRQRHGLHVSGRSCEAWSARSRTGWRAHTEHERDRDADGDAQRW